MYGYSLRKSLYALIQGCHTRGAGGTMLTLSQPRGADYAHQIILAPPDSQTFPQLGITMYVAEVNCPTGLSFR